MDNKCKVCGGELDSYLAYSDAENDYYFPVCWTCVANKEKRIEDGRINIAENAE